MRLLRQNETGATMIEYAVLGTLFVGTFLMVAYLSRQTATVAGAEAQSARICYQIPVLYSSTDTENASDWGCSSDFN